MKKITAVLSAMLLTGAVSGAAFAQAQDGAEWDQAHAQHVANPAGAMAQAIERWKLLTATDRFGFADYAGFLISPSRAISRSRIAGEM